jgi:hypothetical protein
MNKDGQDAQDFRFLVFDFRFEVQRRESKIENQKAKISYPVYPVHPCLSFLDLNRLRRGIGENP